MINNNTEDRIEMAQEIAEVRLSCEVNMYDRQSVINCLFEKGYDFTAEYLRDNKEDFKALLDLSGNYYNKK